jgi:hypothetical protein
MSDDYDGFPFRPKGLVDMFDVNGAKFDKLNFIIHYLTHL